jgi:hypothetical protein
LADNKRTVYRFLLGKGLSPAQAAGVVGGLAGESGAGLSTTAVNPSSGAYGIAQWLGGRKTALMRRPNPSSLRTQLNHLWSELQGPESNAYRQLKSAKSIEDATRVWVLAFERPGAHERTLGPRTATARQVFNQLQGVGPGGPGDAGGGATRATRGTTRTTTTTIPGVDNTAARLALVQSFLDDDNADILDFAAQAKQLKDVPPVVKRTTERIPGAPTSRGGDTGATGGGERVGELAELFYDPQGGWKHGQKIPAIGGHSDHVHVAGGPRTMLAAGKLAERMGLAVRENPAWDPVDPVHTQGSYHYKTGRVGGRKVGQAIDVSGSPQKMAAYTRRLRRTYGLG